MRTEDERYQRGLGHGCSDGRMHSEDERCWGLHMDAMVNVCIRNTNVNMAWTWMLWFWDALGARTILWYGHGCPGFGMHSDDERYHGLGMDPLVIGCTRNTNAIMFWAWMLWLSDARGTRTSLWFGHGCFGERMHSEHERHYGLGMDALVSVCIRNKNVIIFWAWMLC